PDAAATLQVEVPHRGQAGTVAGEKLAAVAEHDLVHVVGPAAAEHTAEVDHDVAVVTGDGAVVPDQAALDDQVGVAEADRPAGCHRPGHRVVDAEIGDAAAAQGQVGPGVVHRAA